MTLHLPAEPAPVWASLGLAVRALGTLVDNALAFGPAAKAATPALLTAIGKGDVEGRVAGIGQDNLVKVGVDAGLSMNPPPINLPKAAPAPAAKPATPAADGEDVPF